MNDRNDRRKDGQNRSNGNQASHGGYPKRLESPIFGSDRFSARPTHRESQANTATRFGVRPASDYGFVGDDRFSGRELRLQGDGFPIAGDFRLGHDAPNHAHVDGWGGSVPDDHDLTNVGPYENRWATRPDPRFVREHGFAGPYVGRGPKGYVRSDERIREEICEMLYLQGYVNTAEVEVGVKNGEVTFTGSVQSRGDKRFIEEMVERVAGVVEIHNQIRRTRPTGEPERRADAPEQGAADAKTKAEQPRATTRH